MSDFKLFSIKNDVVELPASQGSLEKELQTLLEKNMQTFFGVTFLRSEYKITNGRMDSSESMKIIVPLFLNTSAASMRM